VVRGLANKHSAKQKCGIAGNKDGGRVSEQTASVTFITGWVIQVLLQLQLLNIFAKSFGGIMYQIA